MCRHLKPGYSHVILVSGCQLTKTWMCNIRLQPPTLARKYEISHWLPCGVDGRPVTWLPKFLGWIDN